MEPQPPRAPRNTESHWPNATEVRCLFAAAERGLSPLQLSVLEKQVDPSAYSNPKTLGLCLCYHYEPSDRKRLSIQRNPFLTSVLTCFGKVFPVITEILEEGDTLTPRVVPPRCLQKHHLHASSRPQTGAQKAGLGMGPLRSPPGCLEVWETVPPCFSLHPSALPATSIAEVFSRAIWSSRLSCRKPGSCLAKSTISCTETMASSVKWAKRC